MSEENKKPEYKNPYEVWSQYYEEQYKLWFKYWTQVLNNIQGK